MKNDQEVPENPKLLGGWGEGGSDSPLASVFRFVSSAAGPNEGQEGCVSLIRTIVDPTKEGRDYQVGF
jgi:hypothetical protein